LFTGALARPAGSYVHDRVMRSEPVAPDSIVIACAELHFTSSGQADMAQNVADFFWMRVCASYSAILVTASMACSVAYRD
jgi:hypothetical protein